MPFYKNATESVKIDQTTTTVNTSPRSTTQNSIIFDRKLPCMTSLKIQQSVLIEHPHQQQNETTTTKGGLPVLHS